MISDEQVWDTIFGDDHYVEHHMTIADELADDDLLWVLEYFNARAHGETTIVLRDDENLIADFRRLMEKLRWKR